MGKYIITSPSFSEFRSGEPIAYRAAKTVLESATKNVFEYEFIGKEARARVVGRGSEVDVYLEGIKEPFTFNIEEC